MKFNADALEGEGLFEMRVVTECQGSGAPPSSSAVVSGRIDRVAPSAFGSIHEPADRLWWPGDEISVRFTETLRCSRPFAFTTTLLVNGTAVDNSVDVLCDGNKVEAALARAILDDTTLLGGDVTLRVSGVQDQARNTAPDVAWAFTIGNFSETSATVSLADVRVPADLVGSDDNIADIIARALLDPGQPLEQLVVQPTARKRQATTRGILSFGVTVRPQRDVPNGVNALHLGKQILDNKFVDTSQAHVSIATDEPQSGTGVTVASTPTTTNVGGGMTTSLSASPTATAAVTGSTTEPKLIAQAASAIGLSVTVIVILAIAGCCVVLLSLLVCALLLSKGLHRHQEPDSTAVVPDIETPASIEYANSERRRQALSGAPPTPVPATAPVMSPPAKHHSSRSDTTVITETAVLRRDPSGRPVLERRKTKSRRAPNAAANQY